MGSSVSGQFFVLHRTFFGSPETTYSAPKAPILAWRRRRRRRRRPFAHPFLLGTWERGRRCLTWRKGGTLLEGSQISLAVKAGSCKRRRRRREALSIEIGFEAGPNWWAHNGGGACGRSYRALEVKKRDFGYSLYVFGREKRKCGRNSTAFKLRSRAGSVLVSYRLPVRKPLKSLSCCSSCLDEKNTTTDKPRLPTNKHNGSRKEGRGKTNPSKIVPLFDLDTGNEN